MLSPMNLAATQLACVLVVSANLPHSIATLRTVCVVADMNPRSVLVCRFDARSCECCVHQLSEHPECRDDDSDIV